MATSTWRCCRCRARPTAYCATNLIPSGTRRLHIADQSALTGTNGQDDNEWAFVDADNDGFLDLINGSLTNGAEKLYINNGAFSFASQSGFAGFSPVTDPTLDVAVGDLDGDGIFDVVTAQGEFGNFTNRAYYGRGPADTQPPRFVNVEQLPAISTSPDGPWAVRAVIQDSMVDDGETSVASATLDWTISHLTGSVSGSAELRFIGGLLYRADFGPPAGLLSNGATVEFTLTATDRRGNSTTTPMQSFTICGLQRYGLNLGGNHTALLDGSGTTSPGDTPSLQWTAAGASNTGLLVLALAPAAQVIPQGVLLFDPAQLITVVPITADPSGTGQLPLPIPAIPELTGLHVAAQTIFDVPLALSNGVDLVICP